MNKKVFVVATVVLAVTTAVAAYMQYRSMKYIKSLPAASGGTDNGLPPKGFK